MSTTYSEFGYKPRFEFLRRLGANIVSTNTLEIDGRTVSGGASIVTYIDQAKVDEGIFDATLSSTQLYYVDGHLDITGYSIEVPAGGLMIQGLGFNVSSITTTEENGVIFSSPVGGSGDLLFSDVAFTASGTGSKVFALTDVDGTHAFEYQRVNFNGCVDLGYVDGYRQGLEQGTGRFGGTPTLEFRGTWAGGYFMDTSIVRGITDSTYSLFSSAIGHTFGSRFFSNANIVVPSNVTVFEFAPTNFVNDETFQINGAQFAGAGTVLSGIDETSTKTRVSNTRGIPNTYVGGYWSCTSAAATSFSLVSTPVKLAGTTTASDLEWFSSSNANDLTYDSTIENKLYATFTGSFSGGNTKDFTIVFRQWDDSAGSYVNSSSTTFSTDGNGNYTNLALHSSRITMGENDRVELWIQNDTDTTSITMQEGSQLLLKEA